MIGKTISHYKILEYHQSEVRLIPPPSAFKVVEKTLFPLISTDFPPEGCGNNLVKY
jgi:hypothetical protein